jgi:hypothetical protein
MNYKKLSTLFLCQGKEALARKVYKEKVMPNQNISLIFQDGTKEIFKRKSIIRTTPEFLAKCCRMNSDPVMSFRFYPLDDKPEETKASEKTYLILFYTQHRPGFGDFFSEGIIEKKRIEINPDCYLPSGRPLHKYHWEILNLDLEFSADPTLVLAIIVGNDIDSRYTGRFDRVLVN